MRIRRALVVAHIPLFGFQVASCLGAGGIAAHVMGAHHWSLARLSRHAERFVQIKRAALAEGSAKLAARINRYCRTHGLDVVVPADLESSRSLLKIAKWLRVPVFPIADAVTLDVLDNKWSFARLARAAGVAHPRTRLLSSCDGVDSLALGWPVIVKPLNDASSTGVYVIESREDLLAYLDTGGRHAQLPLLVQEFIPGYDMSFFALANRGQIVAWTIQRRVREQHAMEFVANREMLEIGRRLIAMTNYHGVIDFDMRWDTKNNRPLVIEANPRFTGSLMHKLWAGVNFPVLGLRLLDPDAGDFAAAPGFKPVTGISNDVGLAPKHLIRAALGGPTLSAALGSDASRRAFSLTWKDPLPRAFSLAAKFIGHLRAGRREETAADTHAANIFAPTSGRSTSPVHATLPIRIGLADGQRSLPRYADALHA